MILALLCHAGGGEDGERPIVPFRGLATPLADMLKETPYIGMYGPEVPITPARGLEEPLRGCDWKRTLAETNFLEHLAASDAPMRVAQPCVLAARWPPPRRTPPPSPAPAAPD